MNEIYPQLTFSFTQLGHLQLAANIQSYFIAFYFSQVWVYSHHAINLTPLQPTNLIYFIYYITIIFKHLLYFIDKWIKDFHTLLHPDVAFVKL